MKTLNTVFNHPVAIAIARIAIVLFIIDVIKKSFKLELSLPINHSAAYNLGFITGIIANTVVKLLGALVILRLLFKPAPVNETEYSEDLQ